MKNDVLLCMDAKGRNKRAIVVVYSSSKLSMHVTRRLQFVYKSDIHSIIDPCICTKSRYAVHIEYNMFIIIGLGYVTRYLP